MHITTERKKRFFFRNCFLFKFFKRHLRSSNSEIPIMKIDLNNLPDEVLLYSNDEFYQFIEDCLGFDEMTIIKAQSIRSTPSLINVPDVLEVLKLNCKELLEIKKRLCFMTDTDEFVVKAGVKAGIDTLITSLKEKNIRYLKLIKRNNPSSQKLPTYNLSNNGSTRNVTTESSPGQIFTALSTTTPNQSLTTEEHLQNIVFAIERFCTNTFDDILLKHDVDYSIFLDSLSRNIHGRIKCGCCELIKIYFRSNTNSFQLSSYFKHLKISRCSMMKNKKRVLISKMKESISHQSTNGEKSMNDSLDIEKLNENVHDDTNSESDSSSTTIDTSPPRNFHSMEKKCSSSIVVSNKGKRKKC